MKSKTKKALKNLIGGILAGIAISALGVVISYFSVNRVIAMFENRPEVGIAVNGIPIPPILLPILGAIVGVVIVVLGIMAIFAAFHDWRYRHLG